MRSLTGFQINAGLCKSAAKLCAVYMANEDENPFSVFTSPDGCENERIQDVRFGTATHQKFRGCP